MTMYGRATPSEDQGMLPRLNREQPPNSQFKLFNVHYCWSWSRLSLDPHLDLDSYKSTMEDDGYDEGDWDEFRVCSCPIIDTS